MAFRIAIFAAFLVIGCQAFPFELNVVRHCELRFTAESLEATVRTQEAFKACAVDPKVDRILRDTISRSSSLLPPHDLPSKLNVFLEDYALFTDLRGRSEDLPLSMFLSVELPLMNSIRICNYDMKESESLRTIVAHEMGHMLIEWHARANGITKPNEKMSQEHWAGSIYEGVADYISATINNTHLIGGPREWFTRDILKFKTFDQAMQSRETSLDIVEYGLRSENLIPQFNTYDEMISKYRTEIAQIPDFHDSYNLGSWLAGQLWQLNYLRDKDKIFKAILRLIDGGQRYTDPKKFLSDVMAASRQ